jgi:hypothetical protein
VQRVYGESRGTYGIWWESLRQSYFLEHLGTDGEKLILNWVFRKNDGLDKVEFGLQKMYEISCLADTYLSFHVGVTFSISPFSRKVVTGRSACVCVRARACARVRACARACVCVLLETRF